MLSERYYWILLIVGLIVFVSLVGFLFIPYQIIDYNLGINLISESFGIVFTIIFLTWLLKLREQRRWSSIKKRIIDKLKDQIDILFMLLQNLCEITQDKEDSALAELSSAEEIPLRSDIAKYLSKNGYDIQGYIESLEEISETLHNIQIEYSKFLESELLDSLMVVEDGSRNLAHNLRTLKMITWGPYKDSEKKFFEEIFAPIVQECIKGIQKTHEMGIEIRGRGGYRLRIRPGGDAESK